MLKQLLFPDKPNLQYQRTSASTVKTMHVIVTTHRTTFGDTVGQCADMVFHESHSGDYEIKTGFCVLNQKYKKWPVFIQKFLCRWYITDKLKTTVLSIVENRISLDEFNEVHVYINGKKVLSCVGK